VVSHIHVEVVMSDEAVYVSNSTARSLWQEYRIYDDHLEFSTMFGVMRIPFDTIETIDVRESDVKGLLKGDLGLKNFRPALKIDWANFQEHVVLDRAEGFCKRILFTPEEPQQFKKVLEDNLAQFRSRQTA
jgi:hypothetical protein